MAQWTSRARPMQGRPSVRQARARTPSSVRPRTGSSPRGTVGDLRHWDSAALAHLERIGVPEALARRYGYDRAQADDEEAVVAAMHLLFEFEELEVNVYTHMLRQPLERQLAYALLFLDDQMGLDH